MASTTDKDEALLERWRAKRDAEAFGEIVRRYSATVHGTARWILVEVGHAEDVTQASPPRCLL